MCFDATLSLERRPWSARGDPPRARPLSGDDRRRHGGDSLAGAEVVVEGRAGRASPHRGRRGRTRGIRGRDGRADRSGDGAMSMLTQWAKTAFLSGLDGVTGGTLTVECPDRTYRFGDAWRAGRDPDGPRRAVLSAGADGQRHRPRRVLHGRRLDDAGPGAPGAADAAEPSGARGAEPRHRRTAPAGGRRRAPPPGQLPRREPPAHPSALRPRQRVLPPLSRCRAADVLLRLLRIGR